MVSQIAGKKTRTEIIFYIECKMPDAYDQKTLPVESTFIFFNVLYFSLITQKLEENSSKYFLCFF